MTGAAFLGGPFSLCQGERKGLSHSLIRVRSSVICCVLRFLAWFQGCQQACASLKACPA